VDLLIVVGILRDVIVDGHRVNRIYLRAFQAILAMQAVSTYLERINPTWWQCATHAILGV
jgi:hypothetical protein